MSVRETWRQAALSGEAQVFFTRHGTVGSGHCAISLVINCQPSFSEARELAFGPFLRETYESCPVDGCDFGTRCTSSLAIHLNNEHQWDWLTLANKFPAILPEDHYAGLLP